MILIAALCVVAAIFVVACAFLAYGAFASSADYETMYLAFLAMVSAIIACGFLAAARLVLRVG